jgi:hypothetical protein
MQWQIALLVFLSSQLRTLWRFEKPGYLLDVPIRDQLMYHILRHDRFLTLAKQGKTKQNKTSADSFNVK